MKKIVIASDSFKGSLSSSQVATAVERGVRAVFPECEVRRAIIADGGEGTVEAIVRSSEGSFLDIPVCGPLGGQGIARYGLIGGGQTAVIEMASAAGLPLVPPGRRDPSRTTTRGVGEMIADALKHGCRKLLVGIGGSATNDAGVGMLSALGFRFLDAAGNELCGGGEILGSIVNIVASGLDPALEGVEITVACDVDNPFYGPWGAAHVFAPQKGADEAMVARLDEGMRRFAEVIKEYNGTDLQQIAGSGAAGGLGGAFVALLGARLVPGIELVLEALNFDKMIEGADLVITGEGKLDAQTAMGKAPRGVLDAAARHGVPVIALGGAVEESGQLNKQGFAAVFPILPRPATLAEAMEEGFAAANVERTITQILNIIKTFR